MDDTFPYPHLDDERINDVEDKEFEAMTKEERIASIEKMLEDVEQFKARG